jgi:hypothetical protein
VTDRIHVTVGSPPWRPANGTQLVKVIQRATRPLIGIVAQNEVKYVFWCLTGHADESNLWLYAHVTDPEAAELASAKTPAELNDLLRSITVDRAEVYALATTSGDQNRGIILTGVVDPPLGFGELHLQRIIDGLNAQVRDLTTTVEAVSSEGDHELSGV